MMDSNKFRWLLDGNRKWWADYFVWGFAVAVLMRLIGLGYGQIYCAVTVVVFLIITGLRENWFVLVRFLKRHYIFVTAWIMSILYFKIHPMQDFYQEAAGQFIRALFIVFAGYAIALCSRDILTESIKKAEVLAATSMIVSLVWYFTGTNDAISYFADASYYQNYFTEQGRLVGLQVHPLVEAAVYVAFMMPSFGVIDNRYLRAAFLMIGTVCLLLTGTRMAIMVFFAGIIAYTVFSKDYKNMVDTVKKNRMGILLIAGAGLFAIFVAFKMGMFQTVTERFSNIMDGGNTYRLDAWIELCRIFFDRPITKVIGGSGLDGARMALSSDEWLISKYGDYAGVVDNMFLSVAYNYGLVGIVSMVYITVSALTSFVRTDDKLEKSIALAMLCFLAQSLTADFQGWINIMFIFLTLCGIHLAMRESPTV